MAAGFVIAGSLVGGSLLVEVASCLPCNERAWDAFYESSIRRRRPSSSNWG